MNGDENKTVRQEMPSSVSFRQTAKGTWRGEVKLYSFSDEDLKLRLTSILNYIESEIKTRNEFKRWEAPK